MFRGDGICSLRTSSASKTSTFAASDGTEFHSCLVRLSYTGCEDSSNGATICYCEEDGWGAFKFKHIKKTPIVI